MLRRSCRGSGVRDDLPALVEHARCDRRLGDGNARHACVQIVMCVDVVLDAVDGDVANAARHS